MLAVVLPGRLYPTTAPLLALATDSLERHGYAVRPVSWTLPDDVPDLDRWVEARLEEALDDDVPDVVVAKSLGTRAASYAAARAWPAVWLTPLLRDATCAAGVRGNSAPQLVVAGLADAIHDPDVAAGLACDVLELAGADHALSHDGSMTVRDDVRDEVGTAVDTFLEGLA